ncbi:MAG: hypothetical protein IPM82_16670 [Saprospiraceae bacterium]|nr:hypothetical protein [Saprospiraceae bacterium]
MEKVGFDTYLTFVQKMGDKVRYESAVQVLKKEEYLPNLTEQEAHKIWQKGDELFAWNEEVVINVIRQAGINPDVNNWDYGDAGGWEDPVLLDSADVEEGTDWEETIEQDTPIIEQEEVVEEVTPMPEADTLQYEEYDEFDFDGLEWALTPDTAAYAWAMKVLNKDFLQPITRNDRYAMAKGKTDDVHFWIDYGFFTESIPKSESG